jgi:hypothetical protein
MGRSIEESGMVKAASTEASSAVEASARLDSSTVKACLAEVRKEPAGNAWEQSFLERVVARLEALIG